MTIGTYALFAVTGGLVMFKLSLMALAVFLLVRSLLPNSKSGASHPTMASLPLRSDASR